MEVDPAARRVIDLALAETEIEKLLPGLIRVALGRQSIIEAALEECLRLAREGSTAHAEAASLLERTLEHRNLWGT